MDKVEKLEKYVTKNNIYGISSITSGFRLWDNIRGETFKKSSTLLGLLDE